MDEWTPCDEDKHGVERALVWVALTNGGELAYCRHHYLEHADALRDAHAVVIDYSHLVGFA